MTIRQPIDALACIQRIRLLETKVGLKVRYESLDAAGFGPVLYDSEIQRAAKRIGDFLGLHDTVFNIRRAKLKDGVAGRIKPDANAREVPIELSSDIAFSRGLVLATLAHEITHQYLVRNGIPAPDTIENELFTDTAAIFLGLGKLLLGGAQGCHQTPHESVKVGYLSVREAAFVYLLVAVMRGVPPGIYEAGIQSETICLLRAIRLDHEYYFDERFRSGNTDISLSQRAASQTDAAQRALAELKSVVAHLSVLIDRHAQKLSSEVHGKIAALQTLAADCGGPVPDPCLTYLRTLETEIGVRSRTEVLTSDLNKARGMYQEALAVNQFIYDRCPSFSIELKDSLDTAQCQQCGALLRVGARLDLKKVRCPKCRYTFYAKTAKPGVGRRRRFVSFFKSTQFSE
jgi:hypothetical protein